eukprot:5550-Heterococcus_DN1.PRE.11
MPHLHRVDWHLLLYCVVAANHRRCRPRELLHGSNLSQHAVLREQANDSSATSIAAVVCSNQQSLVALKVSTASSNDVHVNTGDTYFQRTPLSTNARVAPVQQCYCTSSWALELLFGTDIHVFRAACICYATSHKLILQPQQKDAEATLEAISEQLDAIVIATASPEETAFVVGMAAAYRLGHAVTNATASTTTNDSDTTTSTSTTASGNSQNHTVLPQLDFRRVSTLGLHCCLSSAVQLAHVNCTYGCYTVCDTVTAAALEQ